MMTWEEIIIEIRKDPSYKTLVELAYFEENLPLNVARFRHSSEFHETCAIIGQYIPLEMGTKILDIGAGNGVASLAFALAGYEVTAVEPDPSNTIGNGAIAKLKAHYDVANLNVDGSYGEKLPFGDGTFDIVYIRQAMHHAHDLDMFVKEGARVLREGGLFVSVRDHVILDEADKQWFLKSHPLHRFYGGENAFTFEQYRMAITSAGLTIRKILRHYDSIINYFPETTESVEERKNARKQLVQSNLNRRLPGTLARNPLVISLYERRLNNSLGKVLDETKIPGRMISFFAVKS